LQPFIFDLPMEVSLAIRINNNKPGKGPAKEQVAKPVVALTFGATSPQKVLILQDHLQALSHRLSLLGLSLLDSLTHSDESSYGREGGSFD
jgi:hypothetical protein